MLQDKQLTAYVIALKIIGFVNLLARDSVSKSAMCKTCEKMFLHHGSRCLRFKAKTAVSLLEP